MSEQNHSTSRAKPIEAPSKSLILIFSAFALVHLPSCDEGEGLDSALEQASVIGETESIPPGEDRLAEEAAELISVEDEPFHAYYLCIDACDELVSCWRKCVSGNKITNCLKSGYSCNINKFE